MTDDLLIDDEYKRGARLYRAVWIEERKTYSAADNYRTPSVSRETCRSRGYAKPGLAKAALTRRLSDGWRTEIVTETWIEVMDAVETMDYRIIT